MARPKTTSKRLPAGKLAIKLGVPERTLTRLLAAAGVKSQRGYDPDPAAKAAIAHYRAVSEQFDAEVAKDRARKIKTDADVAALEHSRMEGELIPTAKVAVLLEQLHIAIRQKICASSLAGSERTELLQDLVAIGERDWSEELRRHKR